MHGALGAYGMNREGSGTAWIPETTPMEGWHWMEGEWSLMAHGYANFVYDHQGGRRGDDKAFSESMGMLMASRPLGPGTLGLRTMFSLDPLMGKNGYPLLLQTGETADGASHLIDRQHPHDLFMELAGTYSLPVTDDASVFVYGGLPGEPALGPSTFMHRFSGVDNPEAPITHHWLDSTHITWGVVTLGGVWQNWKLETSAFHGREPDEHRYDFETGTLDSASARLSWNPTPNWALQVSHGYIESPEQLEPDANVHRTTASASYHLPFGEHNAHQWQTTLAWGLNQDNEGHDENAWLLESSVKLEDRHTFFARVEYAKKHELFDDTSPLAGEGFTVGKYSLGFVEDVWKKNHVALGIGGVGSLYDLPGEIKPAYGDTPFSYMIFTRVKLY